MFTLCLQWHCSAFTGQWVVPASPHQCLTCSPASGLCILPSVSPHQSPAGLLTWPPQRAPFLFTMLFLHILYPILTAKGKLLCFHLKRTLHCPCLKSWNYCHSLVSLHLSLVGVKSALHPSCCLSAAVTHRSVCSHNLQDILMTPVGPFHLRMFHELWSCPLRKFTAGTAGYIDFILLPTASLSNFWAKFPSSLILSCFKAVLKKLLTQSWPSSASMRHPSVLIKGLALLFNWRVAGGTTAHRLRHSLHHKGTQIVFHLWATVHKWLSWKVIVGLGMFCHIWPPTGKSLHRKASTKNAFTKIQL